MFKKLFAAFVVMVFAYNCSFAQMNKNYDGPRPEVYKGSKSFMFTYTPFQSDLGSVNAGETGFGTDDQLGGVGFRYFVTSNWALGLGLNFGTSSDNENDSASFKSTSFGVSLDANYHFKPLYSVSPYVGLNLNYGMGKVEEENINPGFTSEEISNNVFGAGLNLGFDWYFTEGISLGGRYTLGFKNIGGGTFKSTTTGGVTTEVEGESDTVFGTGIGTFMLNVHF